MLLIKKRATMINKGVGALPLRPPSYDRVRFLGGSRKEVIMHKPPLTVLVVYRRPVDRARLMRALAALIRRSSPAEGSRERAS